MNLNLEKRLEDVKRKMSILAEERKSIEKEYYDGIEEYYKNLEHRSFQEINDNNLVNRYTHFAKYLGCDEYGHRFVVYSAWIGWYEGVFKMNIITNTITLSDTVEMFEKRFKEITEEEYKHSINLMMDSWLASMYFKPYTRLFVYCPSAL